MFTAVGALTLPPILTDVEETSCNVPPAIADVTPRVTGFTELERNASPVGALTSSLVASVRTGCASDRMDPPVPEVAPAALPCLFRTTLLLRTGPTSLFEAVLFLRFSPFPALTLRPF